MNFAAQLVERLTPDSCLTDASTEEVVGRGNLGERIASSGAALRDAGFQEGDRIVLCCDLTPRTVLAYLGAIYAGLVAVPVDQKVFREKIAEILSATEAHGVWIPSEKFRPNEPLLEEGIFVAGDLVASTGDALDPSEGDEERLAALMMTSGSTRAPRFVMVTHGNLQSNTEAIARSQDLEAGDSAMLVMPINYVFGASVLHSHLYVGGSVVFDKRFMFPDKVLEAITKFGCASFAGVPSAYSLLLNHSSLGRIEMPSLKRLLQAGGALPVSSIERLRERLPKVLLYLMYGQTEATARITCLPPELLDRKAGSVGVALDNLAVDVLGEEDQILAEGETGEIFVSGPSVSPGYWKDPAHEEVFWNGGLRTGDIGYRDEDGVFWITGRKGDFVKMQGYRVSLSEVNDCVHSVDGVDECGAVRVPHEDAGEAVVLLVTSVVTVEEFGDLELRIRRAMPAHWVCERVEFVDHLPKNVNGKISRSSLEELARAKGVA